MTGNHQKLYEPATLHKYSVYIMSVINFFLPHLTSPGPKGHVRYNRRISSSPVITRGLNLSRKFSLSQGKIFDVTDQKWLFSWRH